jgi:hypothetical protein
MVNARIVALFLVTHICYLDSADSFAQGPRGDVDSSLAPDQTADSSNAYF